MPSFDVVSETDMHEVNNAIDQSKREIGTRFDFKNSDAKIDFKNDCIILSANNDFQISQMQDVIYHKMTKRNVDIKCFDPGNIETAGMTSRKNITIRQGIDKESAKKIVKAIKEGKLKVQAAIQGEQVRVTGKKRDDLQNAMALLRQLKVELPLQFTNFRD